MSCLLNPTVSIVFRSTFRIEFPHILFQTKLGQLGRSLNYLILCISSCCCCLVAQSCPTLCEPMDRSTPGSSVLTVPQSLLRLISTELMMPFNSLLVCHPLLLLPSIFPSIRVFSNELVLRIRWPKYWSFSFNISPSNEHSGLTSFRIDWFDLLEVQETLKSLLQHHSSKASVLWHLAFFMVQLSHPYISTGKTIAWTRWTSVGKVMSQLFNMLSRLIIGFLPRSIF